MRWLWGVVGATSGLLLSTAVAVEAADLHPMVALSIGVDGGPGASTTTTSTANGATSSSMPTTSGPSVTSTSVAGASTTAASSSSTASTVGSPTSSTRPSEPASPCPAGSAAVRFDLRTLESLQAGHREVISVLLHFDDVAELAAAEGLIEVLGPEVLAAYQTEVDARAANALLVAGLPAGRLVQDAALHVTPEPVDGGAGGNAATPAQTVWANMPVAVDNVAEVCRLAGAFDVLRIGAYGSGDEFGPSPQVGPGDPAAPTTTSTTSPTSPVPPSVPVVTVPNPTGPTPTGTTAPGGPSR